MSGRITVPMAVYTAEVVATEDLSPTLRRVVLGGQGLAGYRTTGVGDEYIRLLFPAEGTKEPVLPTITAETNFPLGLFRAWTVWRPAAEVLVYPKPEQPAHPLPGLAPSPGMARAARQQGGGAEFEGVRAYRRGDPIRQVVWKKMARSNELISRDASSSANQELWLDLRNHSALDLEAQLSRLAAWVLMADRLGLNYGLRLPGHEVACATGDGHRRQALQLLACWPAGAIR